MEYLHYTLTERDQVIDVLAVRQFWGKEEEIARSIQHAIVIPAVDTLFLLPLDTKAEAVPKEPTIIAGGVQYKSGDSCSRCIHRLKKVTGGCEVCVFSPVQPKKSVFQLEETLGFLEKEGKRIHLFGLMERKSIYEIFYLYQLKPFFDTAGRNSRVRADDFSDFAKAFGGVTRYVSNDEIWIEYEGEMYYAKCYGGYVDKTLYRVGKEEIDIMTELAVVDLRRQEQKLQFLYQIQKR